MLLADQAVGEVSERLKIGDSFISKILKKGDVLYG